MNETGDSDGDGVCNDTDICPLDQLDDQDNDGICDSDDFCFGMNETGDSDGDGVCNDTDICPLDQLDDQDNDTICDSDDVCPQIPYPEGHDWDYNTDLNGNLITEDQCINGIEIELLDGQILTIEGVWDSFSNTCGDGICDSNDE
jgi:hypothetical protein